MLPFCSKDLKEFVLKWNYSFPIDRWYRDKYKIPFNSTAHKNLSFIDMYFEYLEHYLFNVYYLEKRKIEDKKKNLEEEYIKGEGNFMKEIVISQNDIDRIFEELDIDSM
ncbi:hypothetical protein SJC03_217 [Bacteroides phage SJC03]|nr:hypothetical protein SJC03_217 [Bacteroides phage SJC03]